MRHALTMLALLVACREGTSPPPAVVVPTVAPSAPAVSASDAGAPTPERDASFDFVKRPPDTVGQLLTALGIPIGAVWESREKTGMGSFDVKDPTKDLRWLRVEYRWDMYHTNPVTKAEGLLPKTLEHWSVAFPNERREACVRALGGPGAAVAKLDSERTPVEQYGAFYLSTSGDRFTLQWFRDAPDWSKAKVDAAARKKAVADLAHNVASASTLDELSKATSKAYAGAGITSKGSLNHNDESIEFEPPMNAREFAAAIGHPQMIGESVGVHMSHFRLVDVKGGSTSNPKLGSWGVEASLDGRPTGPEDTRFGTGPIAYYALGPTDVVRHVRFFTPKP